VCDVADSSIGAVVIGRNEGELLRKCLASVLPQASRTVYVDSGSTDGSVELAIGMGAEVVELGRDVPFTAARARNVGWRKLSDAEGDIQYVQFVDGDCTVVASWMEIAARVLAESAETAIVFGHVREAEPNRNIYHRLAAMEWDSPVGEVPYCGGIAAVRTAALQEVGGFRDDLVAGEEPELCVRLRRAGWSVRKLDYEMAVHDIDTDSFADWWRRTVRSGRAYAAGAALHGDSPQQHWVRESRSIWIWGVILPLVALALAWPSRGLSLGFALAMYLALFAKIVIARRNHRYESFSGAALYAGMCVVAKVPQAIGQVGYLAGRASYFGSHRDA